MGFYQNNIVPCLIHLSMRQQNLLPYRQRVSRAAEGRVLEIGIGSGLNLGLYGDKVEQVIGLDPSAKLLGMAREAARQVSPDVELLEGSAELVPLEDRSVDTVVTTWTLCTIPDPGRALSEVRRILKPSGRLLFVEHGQAPETSVRRWQDGLNPLWKRISGGCHLNRAIGEIVRHGGFHIERLETGYMRGPKPMVFMYEGSARPN